MSQKTIDHYNDLFLSRYDEFDKLSESDTRAKIIDPVFKEILGWAEEDIRRETHVNHGYLDYLISINGIKTFVLEAKKTGYGFEVPSSLSRRNYKIGGTIWNNRKIRESLEQAHTYAVDSGVRYAVISNGHQFILFEAFKPGGSWKDGYCLIFKSLKDIKKNFILFMNVLSKESVSKGSFNKYLSEKKQVLKFIKPLAFFQYEEQKVSQNNIARFLYPFIESIFGEMIEDYQENLLQRCYVHQRMNKEAGNFIKPRFDSPPHYSDQYGIEWFRETKSDAGEFQISFKKCEEFLRKETSEGSLILLLGGIGSGKTTFIHHFFKVTLKKNPKILWFYVDFRNATPNTDVIEDYIYKSIRNDYEIRYSKDIDPILNEVGLESIGDNYIDILRAFTILNLKGYTLSIVLDNVDQHSYISPLYQEHVYIIGNNLTKNFKTITIITLREESFFKSTQSKVINAYNTATKIFHISSPRFVAVMNNRLDYINGVLLYDEQSIGQILKTRVELGENKKDVLRFFTILRNSLDLRSRQGKEILHFMDDITGGNLRQSLNFINKFMTSGNTDIREMFFLDDKSKLDQKRKGYFIPYHHLVKSIILEDSFYYSINRSQIMNVFDINPEYTNSHFIHLKILEYLYYKINNYTPIGKGYAYISSILQDGEESGINQGAIIDSIDKLVQFGLIEFDNQAKEGYKKASYVRITVTGLYYMEKLMNKFVYLDVVWGDTPISDEAVVKKLRRRINYRKIKDDLERTLFRFNNTETFLKYLKKMEDEEILNNPIYENSIFSTKVFIDELSEKFFQEKKYIVERMVLNRNRYGPPISKKIMNEVNKQKYQLLD